MTCGTHIQRWWVGVMALCVVAIGSTAHAATGKVGVTHALTKIRPTTPAPSALVATLSAARNEFEAFQIVVQGLDGGVQGVSMTASALAGPEGASIPASRIVLYREGLYPVVTASNTEGAKGDWPDPLIPDVDPYFNEKRNAFPFDVPAGQSRAVWVDLFVPPGTPAGHYTGTVTVTGAGLGTVEVPVQLHVRGFTLPSTASLKTAFGMGWNDACVAHHGSYEACGYDAGVEKYHVLYARAALDHRISLETVVYHFGDFASFDTTYGPLLNGTAPTRLAGARLTTIRLAPPTSQLAGWKAHFDQKGWGDIAFDYTCDEPPAGCPWSSILPQAKAVQAAGVPPLVTTDYNDANTHGLLDHIDILVPIVQYMHPKDGNSQRAVYDQFLSKSSKKQLWWYQSCISHGCGTGCSATVDPWYTGWPSYAIDSAAIQNRAMEWLSYSYDISGELYFQTTHMLKTAWTNSCDFSGNGDGTMFYPGTPQQIGGKTHIPVDSIRMKLIREGMEDYEYLKLLETLGDETFARTTVLGLFPKPSKVADATPEALYGARAALAARIEELTPEAPADCVPLSCPQAGVQCGSAPDGCGGTLACGGCASGEVCGLVAPGLCAKTCEPKSCGAACGAVADGCGATIQCGGCPSGQTCGASTPNVCGATCVPKKCLELGAQCGPVPDGCGATLQCGSCAGGKVCGAQAPNICGTNCVPSTCAALEAECGSVPNGCGGTLNCGPCPAGSLCGLSAPNRCGEAVVPTLDVPAAPGAVVVDGVLSEWDGLTPLSIGSGGAVAEFRLMWTPDALYVAAAVTDSRLLAPATGADEPGLWQSDGIEVLLDPALTLSALPDADDRHVIVSVLGDLFDAAGAGDFADPEVDLGATHAVATMGAVGDAVADAGWNVELRIPFSSLGVSADVGLQLGADLALNNASETGYDTADWAGLASYAQPSLWHRLRLAEGLEPSPTPDEPSTVKDASGSEPDADGPGDDALAGEVSTPLSDLGPGPDEDTVVSADIIGGVEDATVGPPLPITPAQARPSKGRTEVPVLSAQPPVQTKAQSSGCGAAGGGGNLAITFVMIALMAMLRRTRASRV